MYIFSDWIPLSLDDKTANRALWIAKDGAKVVRKTDDAICPVLERPERYEYAPQVQKTILMKMCYAKYLAVLFTGKVWLFEFV